jgi:hypothetical protein
MYIYIYMYNPMQTTKISADSFLDAVGLVASTRWNSCSRFRVWGVGSGVWGLRFEVQGLVTGV